MTKTLLATSVAVRLVGYGAVVTASHNKEPGICLAHALIFAAESLQVAVLIATWAAARRAKRIYEGTFQ